MPRGFFNDNALLDMFPLHWLFRMNYGLCKSELGLSKINPEARPPGYNGQIKLESFAERVKFYYGSICVHFVYVFEFRQQADVIQSMYE